MDIRLRLAPLGLLVALILARLVSPTFLSIPIHDAVPWLKWFGVILVILLYVTAWALTPGFVRIVNRFARLGIVPPLFFIAFLVGFLWAGDLAYAHLIKSWCAGCPEWNFLNTVTAAIFGGH